MSDSDAIRSLIATWRDRAEFYRQRSENALERNYDPSGLVNMARQEVLRTCANELEAAEATHFRSADPRVTHQPGPGVRYESLRACIESIMEADPECRCEHDSDDCCARVSGVDFCARCEIARMLQEFDKEPEATEAPAPRAGLRDSLIWAERQLKALVTEDEGNGAFIRGTGIELAGFGAGMKQLREALRAADPRVTPREQEP